MFFCLLGGCLVGCFCCVFLFLKVFLFFFVFLPNIVMCMFCHVNHVYVDCLNMFFSESICVLLFMVLYCL